MQILPEPCYFENVLSLKNSIQKYFDFYKLSYERNSFNYNFLMPIEDTFEVLLGRDKKKILIPAGINFPFLYRGQQFDYGFCLPTLYREKPSEFQIFIEKLRQTEFMSLIDKHPVVDSFFKKHNFKIDYIGLAQHYGLKTHYIDLTSDIDIALFFAMCKYNTNKDCYEPVKSEENHIAVLYVCVPVLNISFDNNFVFEDKIPIIGLQPFSRPGSQKGFAFNFDINKKFNTFKYTFSYTKKDSEEYFKKFNDGENLWVKDVLVDKVKQLSNKTKFSVETFDKAWELSPIKNCSKNKLKKMLAENDISISTHNEQIFWTNNEIKNIIQKWNEEQIDSFIYQVRRKFWREKENDKGGKKHDFRTLEMLEQLEFLRLVGNRSGIDEYLAQNQNKEVVYNRKNSRDIGWKKISGRYEALKAESFLNRDECIINE